MQRERLGSRLGFILLSAGCAIGIGNVWKFPYMVGQYGGGAFVLVYLFFLIVMGVPIMTMELAMGRASRKSPVRLYQQLEKPGSKWHIHGYVAMAGNYILMLFYTTVAGWMVRYFVDMARGKFVGATPEQIGGMFGEMLSQPGSMVFYMAVVVVAGFWICSIGLQKGLERITKYMMLALMLLILALVINSVLLKGGQEGLKFYLLPDFGRMREIGLWKVIVGAMNQSFFTLSLGIGSIAIFGSYVDNRKALMGEAIHVATLDTFVALASGLIIFPACFAYGVEATSGPSLIFITLPNIFNHLPGGRIWGSLFFVFLTFAAFSTVLAVFENIIACTQDLFQWSRKKAAWINCAIIFLGSLPCALSFNLLSFIQPMGEGSGILDLEDFIVSNLLLPLGSLVFLIFCVSRYGWGWEKFTKEANQGDGAKVKPWMRGYVTFLIPIMILVVFFMGLK